MKINLLKIKELTDLELEYNCELIVNEISSKNLPRFCVSFYDSGVKWNGCIIFENGRGNTIDEALTNYAYLIKNKQFVFNHGDKRLDVSLPKIVHTKLLNI